MLHTLLAEFLTSWRPPGEDGSETLLWVFGVVIAVLLLVIAWMVYQSAKMRRHHRRLLAELAQRHEREGSQHPHPPVK